MSGSRIATWRSDEESKSNSSGRSVHEVLILNSEDHTADYTEGKDTARSSTWAIFKKVLGGNFLFIFFRGHNILDLRFYSH